MTRIINIDARWNNTQARFTAYCVIGQWDGNENDDDIFYYFDTEDIVGDHGEFTVLSFEEVAIA